MADDANITLLLEKLPANSLARRLVQTYATQPAAEALAKATTLIAELQAAHAARVRTRG